MEVVIKLSGLGELRGMSGVFLQVVRGVNDLEEVLGEVPVRESLKQRLDLTEFVEVTVTFVSESELASAECRDVGLRRHRSRRSRGRIGRHPGLLPSPSFSFPLFHDLPYLPQHFPMFRPTPLFQPPSPQSFPQSELLQRQFHQMVILLDILLRTRCRDVPFQVY